MDEPVIIFDEIEVPEIMINSIFQADQVKWGTCRYQCKKFVHSHKKKHTSNCYMLIIFELNYHYFFCI